MERDEQKRIAEELANRFKDELMGRIERIPENWDGHEIRTLAQDIAKTFFVWKQYKLKSSRLKNYNIECLNQNLWY